MAAGDHPPEDMVVAGLSFLLLVGFHVLDGLERPFADQRLMNAGVTSPRTAQQNAATVEGIVEQVLKAPFGDRLSGLVSEAAALQLAQKTADRVSLRRVELKS
jgi:hypothetical protein